MYLFESFKKYSKYICVMYVIFSILTYIFFAKYQDGRIALIWIIFLILAAVHFFEGFAKKFFKWYKNIYINVGLSVSIALLLYFTCANILQIYVIQTSSMQPTIYPKNLVIINKMAYRSTGPRIGDIALIMPNFGSMPMVHRIIAKENDTVKIENGVVTMNGQKTAFCSLDNAEPETIVVPQGAFYHKGDNPNSFHGIVYADQILGKVIYISGGKPL